jgi:hypothetical protein
MTGMKSRAACLWAALAAGWLVAGCGRKDPQGPVAADPTASLPARFKTQEPVPRPDLSQAAGAAEFQRAIADAARLFEVAPKPLRSVGEGGEIKGGVCFEAPAQRIEAVLGEAHADFLSRGYYLFRFERHFEIGGRPDKVGLLATADKYAVMALMDTNGDNYGIGTAGVIAWMKELERKHPYDLTEVGFDYLEGRFASPAKDPEGLARRMYEFCPDIVDQGVGTMKALTESVRAGKLYFWWD